MSKELINTQGFIRQPTFKSFVTTSNLTCDSLNNGGNLAQFSTGLITLTSTSGFPSSGYIRIEDEIIEFDTAGAGANQLNILTRGVFGTSDVEHADFSSVGECFVSDLLTLDTYSQVITKVQSDKDCGMHFVWYSDSAGTKIIRTLTPSFLASTGYDFLSSVAFGPYVRYTIAPTSSTTSELFFTTEFSNYAVQPQLFTLNSGVFGSMISALNRSVLVGQQEGSTNYSNVLTTSDNELLTNTLAGNRKARALYSKTGIAADTYVIMVDLSDTTNFPHNQTGSIDVDSFTASVSFATGTASATIKLGIITRIDGTDADISYLISDVVGVQSGNDTQLISHNYQPSSVVFKQSGGNIVGSVTNDVELTVAAINTGITLDSSRGVTITPAVGDLILKFDYVADTFDASVGILYHSDA